MIQQKIQSLNHFNQPSLWTRLYFVESVGYISQETIKKYIEKQKNI